MEKLKVCVQRLQQMKFNFIFINNILFYTIENNILLMNIKLNQLIFPR